MTNLVRVAFVLSVCSLTLVAIGVGFYREEEPSSKWGVAIFLLASLVPSLASGILVLIDTTRRLRRRPAGSNGGQKNAERQRQGTDPL